MKATKIYLMSSYVSMFLTVVFIVLGATFILEWQSGPVSIIEMVIELGIIAFLLIATRVIKVVSYIMSLFVVFKGTNKDLIESLIDTKLRLIPFSILKIVSSLVFIYWYMRFAVANGNNMQNIVTESLMLSIGVIVAGFINIWTGLLGVAVISKLNKGGCDINKIHYLYQMLFISDIYSTLKIKKLVGDKENNE